MLHVYFKPDGKVLVGTNAQTAFDSEASCPQMSSALAETGGASSLTLLAALALPMVGTGVVLAFGVIRRSL